MDTTTLLVIVLWCCCSAAADSSTDAGLESEGRLARRDHSPPNGRCTAPTGVSPILARSATVHVARSKIDTSFHSPFAGYTVSCQAKIATSPVRARL
jgi:hypothetical protein